MRKFISNDFISRIFNQPTINKKSREELEIHNVIVMHHKPHCTIHVDKPSLFLQPSYSERWDAYYCEPCNRWLEKGCGRSKVGSLIEACPFDCINRPEKPL